ncbi:MAG TPA: hypothetical protein VLT82_07240 [Myxococcaceae bacterium]|nr:hypothetical protein [Myxococcaceae bacterium]
MNSRRSNRRVQRICALALCGLGAVVRAAPAPCELLTPAEIAAAVGGSFGAGQPIGTTGCSWTSEKPHVIVTVSLWPSKEWDRLKASPLPGTTITAASGLGDDAFYATLAQYTMLYVKKGQTVYLFKVYGVADKAKQSNAEKSLAQDALARL